MIDWDRYWKRYDRAKKQSEERGQLLKQEVMEILQDCGPLTAKEIADYLGQYGWQFASANGIKYVLSHQLVGQARQDPNGRWSLIPASSSEAQ
ncbi:MAG TPA: hypothetical protein VKE98_11880 [Gemmataceae bacterium]|nr:hypothetical protein [Gemmataceae bacterium]